MTKHQVVCATVCVCAMLGAAWAEEETSPRLSLGAKVWSVDSSYKWPGESRQDGTGFMYGPIASLDLPMNFWLSALYLQGTIDYKTENLDQKDADLLFGYSFRWLDVGFGFRYQAFKDKLEANEHATTSDKFGPGVYLATGSAFDEAGRIGWFLGGSCMFVDLSNHDKDTEGEHVNIEAGLSAHFGRFVGALGYRYMSLYVAGNHPRRMGPVASVSFDL